MATTTSTKARTDSTDRTPALAKAASSSQPKAPVARFEGARRLLTALMRSLATPHV